MKLYHRIMTRNRAKTTVQITYLSLISVICMIFLGCPRVPYEQVDKCRVPDLKNATVQEVQTMLAQEGFVLGDVFGDGEVVAKQSPTSWSERSCGGHVDVWLESESAISQTVPPSTSQTSSPQASTSQKDPGNSGSFSAGTYSFQSYNYPDRLRVESSHFFNVCV